MKINLTFNKHNNFNPVDKKHGTQKDRMSIIRNALWVINCACSAINANYDEGAPRRIEMNELYVDLIKQLKEQITKEEAEELQIEV